MYITSELKRAKRQVGAALCKLYAVAALQQLEEAVCSSGGLRLAKHPTVAELFGILFF